MSKIGRKHLTLAQSLQVVEYVKENLPTFSGKTSLQVAGEINEKFSLSMTEAMLNRVCREIGATWTRARKVKNVRPIDASKYDSKVMNRRIRTLARIQRRIVDELGIELKPIQKNILIQMCQYDVTAEDDEQ